MGKESSCLGRAKAIANMEEWGFFLGGGGVFFFGLFLLSLNSPGSPSHEILFIVVIGTRLSTNTVLMHVHIGWLSLLNMGSFKYVQSGVGIIN